MYKKSTLILKRAILLNGLFLFASIMAKQEGGSHDKDYLYGY